MKSWNFSIRMNNNQTSNHRETTLEFQCQIFQVRIPKLCIVVSWICVMIRRLSLSRMGLLDFSIRKIPIKMHRLKGFPWIICLWFFKVVPLLKWFLTLSLLHCFIKKKELFWLSSLQKMLLKHIRTSNKSFKLVSLFSS